MRMKSRLTLTISPTISHQAKRKARASGRSLSSLIEELLAKAVETDEAGEAPSTSFSQRWAGKLTLKAEPSPRRERLLSKYAGHP